MGREHSRPVEDLREFRGLLSRAGRVFASPATCLCGAQRELETGRKVRGLEKRWRERNERGRERGEVYGIERPIGYCFPISRALCMGIRLKPSYAEEDSRVTAPAGP